MSHRADPYVYRLTLSDPRSSMLTVYSEEEGLSAEGVSLLLSGDGTVFACNLPDIIQSEELWC